MEKFVYRMAPANDHMQLFASVNGDHLRITRFGQASSLRYDSPGTLGDIQDAIDPIFNYMKTIKPSRFEDSDQHQVVLRRLAALGRELFDIVITPARQAAFIKGLVGAPEVERQGQRVTVIVDDKAIRLPWSFMYGGEIPENGPVDPAGFLGFRFIFLNAPCIDGGSARSDPEGQDYKAGWIEGAAATVGHLWDEDFLQPGLPESQFWYSGFSSIQRDVLLPPLSDLPAVRPKMEERLLDFVVGARDFLHFDCHGHASATANDASQPDLGVLAGFRVGTRTLDQWDFVGDCNLLCVSNACNSGHGRLTNQRGSIAERLRERGVAGVIAPIFSINFHTAMDFSRELYGRLLLGAPIMQAFDLCQQDLMETDIRAMAYAPFGDFAFFNAPMCVPASEPRKAS